MHCEKDMVELSCWLREKARRVHLVGVSGSGMIGLARILLESGHQVSGSDLQCSSQVKALIELGLIFRPEHQSENIKGVELLVFSTAIGEGNPERMAAQENHLRQARRAECLAALADARELLIVAGTHGKTTSTVMLTAVLKEDGREPGFYIGADAPDFGASASAGKGIVFAAEADESDGSILQYHPIGALILNVEEDHLDYYRNLEHILSVFRQVVKQTSGPVVVCADDAQALSLVLGEERGVTYGLEQSADFLAYDICLEERGSMFRVKQHGEDLGEVRLSIPGRHNVSNATGVIALAMSYGVSFESCVRALAKIRGAARRFDVRFQNEAYLIVDDYAHHPTEIKATLAAARKTGRKRIVAAFQPHRYTRTFHLQKEFSKAFKDADSVYLTDIYAAGEKPIEGLNGLAFFELVKKEFGDKAHYAASLKELKTSLSAELGEGDCLITMGAGDIYQVAEKITEELKVLEELREAVGAENVLRPYESMRRHTSLRVGGPCQYWFEPAHEKALARMLKECGLRNIPTTIIGRGTNLLVKDEGFEGVGIYLGNKNFSEIVIKDGLVYAGAGARLKDIVYQAKKSHLGGLEFMEGIPGNLGGALRMNAGAMQAWMMDVTVSVRHMSAEGVINETLVRDMEVQYRNVPLLGKEVALGAVIRGIPTTEPEISRILKEYSKKRWSSQPAAPSAGCTFKNSEHIPTGKLIEELGLKDTTIGGARISPVHGNFIVNDGNATAQDILGLIDMVKSRAKNERGIDLELEVKILGD